MRETNAESQDHSSKSGRAGNQSLERGLQMLDLLDRSPEALGIRELARRMGVAPSMTQRLANTLAAAAYVEQVPDSQRYRIGPRAIGLGSHAIRRDRMLSEAQTQLERLAEMHHLNGYLARLHGGAGLYLLSVQSAGPITIRRPPGDLCPLHSTAVGKVLLAALSDEEAARLLGHGPLERFAPRTLTCPADVIAGLDHIRSRGYAVADDENIQDVLSVATPIRARDGRVRAALSVALLKTLPGELDEERLATLVMEAAARVEASL